MFIWDVQRIRKKGSKIYLPGAPRPSESIFSKIFLHGPEQQGYGNKVLDHFFEKILTSQLGQSFSKTSKKLNFFDSAFSKIRN